MSHRIASLTAGSALGLLASLIVPAAASAAEVRFDQSMSVFQATTYSVVAAGSPLETQADDMQTDLGFGTQGSASITSLATVTNNTPFFTGTSFSSASGSVGSSFDAEGLGDFSFSASHNHSFSGVNATNEGSGSDFLFLGVFSLLESSYRFQGELDSTNTSFAQLVIVDLYDITHVLAQIDNSGSFDVVLPEGDYLLQYQSTLNAGPGGLPSIFASSAASLNISAATAVPLPSSVLGGGALLGALAFRRRR